MNALQERQPRPVEAAAPDAVRFIGNATLLIRFGDLTLLTDPNFVHRDASVPLGFGLTTTRITDPAVDVEDIPQPDVVLLSHDHGDHFDAVAADWLEHDTPIVTCPGAARSLRAKGFGAVRAVPTWRSTTFEKGGTRARVTAAPARHAAGPLDLVLPEVTGSVVEFWRLDAAPRARRGSQAKQADREPDLVLYISGDTVMFSGLAEIARRFPRIDIGFIHLGGMRVMGMPLTLDAEHGVQLVQMVEPRLTIPIHYNDYGSSQSSLSEFVASIRNAGLADRVRYLRHGDSWPLQATSSPPA